MIKFFRVALVVTSLLVSGGAADAAPGSPVAGVKMTVFAIASDPPGDIRSAPGGGRVLTPAVLFAPAPGENVHGPAIVMITRGPGSNPGRADEPTRWAAERLAARGYTVMSLQTHLDRGFPLFPFYETAIEIGAALSALEARGYEDFILIGSSYGAIAAANYVATEADPALDKARERRVKAVVLLDPLTELRNFRGPDLARNYDAVIARAQAAFATGRNGYTKSRTIEIAGGPGAGLDDWLGTGNFIAPAEGILDYWGPQAEERNAKVLRSMPVPALMIAGGKDPTVSPTKLDRLAAAKGIKLLTYSGDDGSHRGAYDKITDDMARWLDGNGLAPRARVEERLVDTLTADGSTLSAMLYLPETIDPKKPALLMTHGRSGDMIQSSTHWMGWRMAQKGYVVLAPSLRISGVTGIEVSTRAEVTQDLKAWMDRFQAIGYPRVIATGHSNGGIWISDYKALTQDPRIVGMVYMAPTVNVDTWDERRANPETMKRYQEAKAAVESGRGTTKVYGVQSAILMYDSLRPEAVSHPERMAKIDIPGLSIIGSEDGLFKPPVVRQRLNGAYKGKLDEIIYQGGSHGFREGKERLATDIDAWIRKTFPK